MLPFSLAGQQALELEECFFKPEATVFFTTELVSGLGMIKEYVFTDPSYNRSFDFILSRLDWPVEPELLLGLKASFRIAEDIWLASGLWVSLPTPSGYLEDRDWDEDTKELKIYSKHDNTLLNALALDLNLGFSIITNPVFILNAVAGLQVQRFFFKGANGYQEIPPGTVVRYFTGDVITYDLFYLTVYIGTEVALKIDENISLTSRLGLSPLLTFAFAFDDHLLREEVELFIDLPAFGFSVQFALSLSFRLTSNIFLKIYNNICFSPIFKGSSYLKLPGETTIYYSFSSRGGSDRLLYQLALALSLPLN